MKKEANQTPPTIKVDMEVVAEADNREALAIIGSETVEERVVHEVKKKQEKTQYVDGPAQRLANIRISIKSKIKRRDELTAEIKDLQRREKKLNKIIDEYNKL